MCSTPFQRQLRQYNLLGMLLLLRRKRRNRKLPLRGLAAELLSPISNTELGLPPHYIQQLFCPVEHIEQDTWPPSLGQLLNCNTEKAIFLFRPQRRHLFFCPTIKLDVCYCHNGKWLLEFTIGCKHGSGTVASLMPKKCEVCSRR